MKTKPSLIIGWVLAALIMLSFFMPWARFGAESFFGNVLGISHHLAQDENDFVHGYILMRPGEWHAVLQHPGDGLSGYQLVVLSGQTSLKSKVEQAFVEMLWGGKHSDWAMKFLLLAPLCAIAGALLITQPKPAPKWLAAVAVIQVVFYGFVRWKLNAAYLDRLVSQVSFNLGFWLCLYGTILMALLLLIRIALPGKSKW